MLPYWNHEKYNVFWLDFTIWKKMKEETDEIDGWQRHWYKIDCLQLFWRSQTTTNNHTMLKKCWNFEYILVTQFLCNICENVCRNSKIREWVLSAAEIHALQKIVPGVAQLAIIIWYPLRIFYYLNKFENKNFKLFQKLKNQTKSEKGSSRGLIPGPPAP